MASAGRALRASRAVAVVGAGLAGAGLAVVGLVVHRMTWRAAGVPLPWGLALGVAATLACGVALRWLGAGRAGSLAFAVAWLGVLFVVLTGRPEGDYLVAADWLGWSYLLLGGGAVAVPVGSALLGPRSASGSDRPS